MQLPPIATHGIASHDHASRHLESGYITSWKRDNTTLKKLAAHATEKLRNKNLDLIVANLVNVPDSGFGTETNQVTLFYRDGTREALPTLSKPAVAHLLLDRIVARRRAGGHE